MNAEDIILYYSNAKIQNEMIRIAKNREIVGSTREHNYLKRPDTLFYPKDIIERVKDGAVAFHCSVERWTNPMLITTGTNLDELRTAFDLIIDIDTKFKIEHGKAAAEAVCNFLRDLGIKPTVKYSGSRGFHIGIAMEAFPQDLGMLSLSGEAQPLAKQYPAIARTMLTFIKESVRDKMLEALRNWEGGIAALTSQLKEHPKELSPYLFLELESNWGARHLFRMPYSLHHKTWRVSLPIKISEIKSFNPEDSVPGKIKTDEQFLTNREGEGMELLLQALEWGARTQKEKKESLPIRTATEKIPEEFFPDCISSILKGIADGKKRSVFTLITFLRSAGWQDSDVDKLLKEWNRKNTPPLPEQYINTQLKWHFRQNRKLLPPSCSVNNFYGDICIVCPHAECRGNPIFEAMENFARRNKKM